MTGTIRKEILFPLSQREYEVAAACCRFSSSWEEHEGNQHKRDESKDLKKVKERLKFYLGTWIQPYLKLNSPGFIFFFRFINQ